MMVATVLSLVLFGAAGPDVEATQKRQTLLYIATSPPGAEVFVDGTRVGTTDGLFPVDPGVRRVIVELEGHDRQGTDVTIRAGDIARLKLRLKPRAGAAVAQATPGPDPAPASPAASAAEPPKDVEPDGPPAGGKHTPSPINEALEVIERNYFLGVDRRELLDVAVRSMVGRLHEASEYFSRAELAHLHRQIESAVGGIGVELKYDPNARQLLVVTPLPGMPAREAGVQAGDVVVEINGQPASSLPKGKELATAAKLLRGKPGNPITISVKRAGSDQSQQIRMTRAALHVPTVLGDCRKADGSWNFVLVDHPDIGYVRLGRFSPGTAEELEAVLKNLQSKGMKGLILDLRNNPGGMFSEAVRISDLFVESGTIVSIKGREESGRTWFAKKEGTLAAYPMAVLVNRASVGASEIVAACLQDNRRAIVGGERTFGKGVAHSLFELEGGDGALKLPTATFVRPNGKDLHRFAGAKESDPWGVVPDETCEVKLSPEEFRRFRKYRQQRDVFSKEGPPQSDFQDRQFRKVIEHLRQQLGRAKAA